MKGISKILLGVGAAAVLVLASMPVAEAQCPQSRTIGAGGGGGMATRVSVSGPAGYTLGAGNEIASMWDSSNAGINSQGPHFNDAGTCDAHGANAWLLTGGMFPGAGNLGVEAFMSSSVCAWTLCPAAGATVITAIELASDDGADAGFIAFTVDETPAGARWWDHARVTGQNGSGDDFDYVLQSFPTVDVSASSGPVPTTTLTNNYANVDINVESAGGAGDSPLPTDATIASYDIMQALSGNDPGRGRGAYSLLKSIPYENAGVSGDSVSVPCGGPGDDSWLAVGVTYVGGVESQLVGRATAVECNPAIANPGGKDLRDRKIRPNRSRSIRRSR